MIDFAIVFCSFDMKFWECFYSSYAWAQTKFRICKQKLEQGGQNNKTQHTHLNFLLKQKVLNNIVAVFAIKVKCAFEAAVDKK